MNRLLIGVVVLAALIILVLYSSRGRIKSLLTRTQVSPAPASEVIPTELPSASPIIYSSSSGMPNTGETLPETGF